MTLDEINDLDFSSVGDWPGIVKAIIIFILCLLLSAAWYFFDIEEQYKSLERAERKEVSLKKDFEKKQARAVNLDAYRNQLADMRESFGAMLRQLPNRTEVADLLVDVSQTGLAAGLEFELFQPQSEKRREFYAELPIGIKVNGSYHEFAEFVSGLASLPRIVTIHNIIVKPTSGKGKSLQLQATAKTYRYLDDGDN